jgi:acyl-CoA thioesterase
MDRLWPISRGKANGPGAEGRFGQDGNARCRIRLESLERLDQRLHRPPFRIGPDPRPGASAWARTPPATLRGVPEDFMFDRATRVDETSDGRWRGEVSPTWNIFGVPNGGYLATVGLAGVSRLVPHPDLLSVSAYYPSRADPGEVLIRHETVRIGKRVSTAVARVEQEDEARVQLTAMYADLSLARGATLLWERRPVFPPPEECVKAEGPVAPEFVQQFDMWLTPETAGWATGHPSGKAEMSGWARFIDGRPPDPASMPLFADCLPPAIFNLEQPAWTPTLELTVHVRARPVPGWLQLRFTTRYLQNGFLEEDGEIWDEGGTLVALSRQLAQART